MKEAAREGGILLGPQPGLRYAQLRGRACTTVAGHETGGCAGGWYSARAIAWVATCPAALAGEPGGSGS